jgi:hypothetical protein
MDSRFIPASLPEGTKKITVEQAQVLLDKGIEITIYWYRGHVLQWGSMHGVINADEVKHVTKGGYVCINEADYWYHFGYDVVFPAISDDKDNLLEFFGNKLTVRLDPDFWGNGNTPVQQWMIILPAGNGAKNRESYDKILAEFMGTDVEDKAKSFILNHYTEIAAKAMPDFKFNFTFQS